MRTILLGVALVSLTSCGIEIKDTDPGATETFDKQIDGGAAEAVRAIIMMGAGELTINGGGEKLFDGKFKYSEKVGRPKVSYELTGFRGQLNVESPKDGSMGGKVVNEWNLTLGGKAPLDLEVKLGAGTNKLDFSQVNVRNLDIKMGVGECNLNLAGDYKKDVNVTVKGGVGGAHIKLPKGVGVIADAAGGIGSINTSGLTKRDGHWFNEAYAAGKPAIHLDVKGGVGEISLNVVE